MLPASARPSPPSPVLPSQRPKGQGRAGASVADTSPGSVTYRSVHELVDDLCKMAMTLCTNWGQVVDCWYWAAPEVGRLPAGT